MPSDYSRGGGSSIQARQVPLVLEGLGIAPLGESDEELFRGLSGRKGITLDVVEQILRKVLAKFWDTVSQEWRGRSHADPERKVMNKEEFLNVLDACRICMASWELHALWDRASTDGEVSLEGAQWAYGWHLRIRSRCLSLLLHRGVSSDVSAMVQMRKAGYEIFYTATSREALGPFPSAGLPARAIQRRALHRSEDVQRSIASLWHSLDALQIDGGMTQEVFSAVFSVVKKNFSSINEAAYDALGDSLQSSSTPHRKWSSVDHNAVAMWKLSCCFTRLTDWEGKKCGSNDKCINFAAFFEAVVDTVDTVLSVVDQASYARNTITTDQYCYVMKQALAGIVQPSIAPNSLRWGPGLTVGENGYPHQRVTWVGTIGEQGGKTYLGQWVIGVAKPSSNATDVGAVTPGEAHELHVDSTKVNIVMVGERQREPNILESVVFDVTSQKQHTPFNKICNRLEDHTHTLHWHALPQEGETSAAPRRAHWPVVPVSPEPALHSSWGAVENLPKNAFARLKPPQHCVLSSPARPVTGPLVSATFLQCHPEPTTALPPPSPQKSKKVYQGLNCRSPSSKGWANSKIFSEVQCSTISPTDTKIDVRGNTPWPTENPVPSTPLDQTTTGCNIKLAAGRIEGAPLPLLGETPRQARPSLASQPRCSQTAMGAKSSAPQRQASPVQRSRAPNKEMFRVRPGEMLPSPYSCVVSGGQPQPCSTRQRNRAATSLGMTENTTQKDNSLLGVVGSSPSGGAVWGSRKAHEWNADDLLGRLSRDRPTNQLQNQFGATMTPSDDGGAGTWLGNTPFGFYTTLPSRVNRKKLRLGTRVY